MTGIEPGKELYILAADKGIKFAVEGLLSRAQRLNIRSPGPEMLTISVHPEHDPGCYQRAHEFLRPFVRVYRYAMVIFDREFDEHNLYPRKKLEEEVEDNLAKNGWRGRSAAVVIDPELESWVFSDSPHVDRILGWERMTPKLRDWLEEKEFIGPGEIKPNRPKEAMRKALREANKSPSASLFRKMAQNVSLKKCEDDSFAKFKTTLQNWFPP